MPACRFSAPCKVCQSCFESISISGFSCLDRRVSCQSLRELIINSLDIVADKLKQARPRTAMKPVKTLGRYRWLLKRSVPDTFAIPFVYHQWVPQGNAKPLTYQDVKFPRGLPGKLVEPRGIEPLTSSLRTRRSPS